MTSETRALVVEDESVLAGLVANYLSREGLTTRTCGDGLAAVDAVREWRPDLLVLDVGLPGIDGIEVCRRVREFSDCYVIMLTARDEEADRLAGLGVGADDYVTKPFSARELVLRAQAMLRRPRARRPDPSPTLHVGDLELDVEAREARRAGEVVRLTRTEFDVVRALAERPHKAFTRRELVDVVWGPDWVGDEHLVDVHIAHARRKLGDDPSDFAYVLTVRGIGYRIGPGR